ncbi:MAG TPA: phosphopantetheine-binding protein [Puia sp.]|nr:phosphopantetheine-binding protein [Puia sp.]
MIPTFLIPLAQFPLNSNGKLDKDRLPGPDESGADPVDHVPFRHDTDKKILEIWEEILEKQGIGIRDNFFDLGGHSLKATRVVSRIHEVFGIGIDLKTLFIEPTVEHLSNYIETIQWMEDKQFTMAEDENEIIF